MVCVTFGSILGPRRSLQKLEMVIVSRSLGVWALSCEESCARVDSVGGSGYCKLIFLTTDGVLC